MLTYENYNINALPIPKIINIRTGKRYLNIECGFDIETTSTYIQGEKVAFMYEWTFGIKDKNFICYGRTWEQFLELCNKLKDYYQLDKNTNLICYIHNFSFEYQFMRKYFNWLNVFSVDDRKPLKALCDLGIEFRDSYILSGYSLSKTAENLQNHKIKKLYGDLDYDLIRHHKTPLTNKELEYCNNDIEIILCYINEQIEQYKDISKIPLTNTGRVRKYVRNNCYYSNTTHQKTSYSKYKKYRKIMQDLTIDSEEYKQLKVSFQGGFTHANSNYTGQIIENVTSIDFTSSYPSVMLSERYPMGKGIKTTLTKEKGLQFYLDNYCLIFDVIFYGLESKITQENYLSDSKCKTKNAIINNGRIYSADYLETTITNIDFEIIKQCYKWEKCKVGNIIRYCRGYLPKSIIESILKLYEDKTTLKGVTGKEVEYLLSKGMLNSVYGMCVTDIVKDTVIYDNNNEWGVVHVDINEELEKYNNSKNRFLSYVWGVFVTAYARKNLWCGIINIGDDYIYSDTDSIKFKNYEKHKKYIEWYNKIIYQKLTRMCDFHNIDYSRLEPKTMKGEKKTLGVWDYEGTYTRFKTLGAKRYITEENNKLHITIAGLSKQDGLNYMLEHCNNDNTKVFNMFTNDLYIPSENTGKMTHTYIDNEYQFIITDYTGLTTEVKTLTGVHLEKCEFTLSIAKEYATFLNNFANGFTYKGVKNI